MESPGNAEPAPGSFRDPAGFVFRRDGSLYRQVNTVYSEHYDRLMESGLYRALVDDGLLVPHDEVPFGDTRPRPEYIAHREVDGPIVPRADSAGRRRAA